MHEITPVELSGAISAAPLGILGRAAGVLLRKRLRFFHHGHAFVQLRSCATA